MQFTNFRKTGDMISRMAFGCWAIVGGFNWGEQDKKDSIEALQTAFDCGINFFDTAEAYGNGESERLIAEGLKHKRNELFIASKVIPDNYAEDKMIEACERSLRNLQTDRIDLYQLHWPNTDFKMEEIFPTLERLKEQGKIREYGVCNFGVKNMNESINAGFEINSNQVSYSLLFRAIENEIIPFCSQNEIDIFCYSPLMQGLLSGKFKHPEEVPDDRARTRHFSKNRPLARHGEAGFEKETFAAIENISQISRELNQSMANVALNWLLAQEGVTSVIMGARNADQVRRNIAAFDATLPQDIIDRLRSATNYLKEKMGANADLWQGNENSRIN